MTDPTITDDLLRMFAAGEQRRAREAAVTYGALTKREQRLVREAVMGFVRGTMHVPGGHKVTIPPDAAVVELVTSSCLSMSELYPEFSRARKRAARREARGRG